MAIKFECQVPDEIRTCVIASQRNLFPLMVTKFLRRIDLDLECSMLRVKNVCVCADENAAVTSFGVFHPSSSTPMKRMSGVFSAVKERLPPTESYTTLHGPSLPWAKPHWACKDFNDSALSLVPEATRRPSVGVIELQLLGLLVQYC